MRADLRQLKKAGVELNNVERSNFSGELVTMCERGDMTGVWRKVGPFTSKKSQSLIKTAFRVDDELFYGVEQAAAGMRKKSMQNFNFKPVAGCASRSAEVADDDLRNLRAAYSRVSAKGFAEVEKSRRAVSH